MAAILTRSQGVNESTMIVIAIKNTVYRLICIIPIYTQYW